MIITINPEIPVKLWVTIHGDHDNYEIEVVWNKKLYSREVNEQIDMWIHNNFDQVEEQVYQQLNVYKCPSF